MSSHDRIALWCEPFCFLTTFSLALCPSLPNTNTHILSRSLSFSRARTLSLPLACARSITAVFSHNLSHCNTLRHTATHYNTLQQMQCVAVFSHDVPNRPFQLFDPNCLVNLSLTHIHTHKHTLSISHSVSASLSLSLCFSRALFFSLSPALSTLHHTMNWSVCCSVLQYVEVCCSVLQCVAVCLSAFSCVAVCCSVLQCVAVFLMVLQCVAVTSHDMFHRPLDTLPRVLQCVAVCCSVLHHVAVCRSVSQCAAAWVLQCVAASCTY